MKIGINTFGCGHGQSGIGSYLSSFVKNMPKSKYEFQLFGHELDKYTYTSNLDNLSYAGIDVGDSISVQKLWHFKNLNSFIKKNKYDAVLYPAGTSFLPPIFTVPSVLIIQSLLSTDLNCITKMGTVHVLKNSAGIITPTHFIKNDIVRLGIDENKIKVISNGIDRTLFKQKDAADSENDDVFLTQPFSIRKPYIVYASRINHPDKCHTELIEAFSLFKQKFKTSHRLVIAGSDGGNLDAVHTAVLQSGCSSDIFLTGHFPHDSLPDLYAEADLCIFPSAIEGVGLPVIEAMACGVPAACAAAGALPEIVGDAAVFFNHKNVAEIAEVIAKLIDCKENEKLRNELILKGLDWIKQYNWKTTASETLAYLDSVLL